MIQYYNVEKSFIFYFKNNSIMTNNILFHALAGLIQLFILFLFAEVKSLLQEDMHTPL